MIYFYTNDRQQVRLGVGFPHGIWTQWYPQAAGLRPSLIEQAERPDRLERRTDLLARRGDTPGGGQVPGEQQTARGWTHSEVVLPPTSSDALWNYARDVDAAYVKTMDRTKDPAPAEFEKFLFYRGLGESRLPLRFAAGHGGTLVLDRDATLGPRDQPRLRHPSREWTRSVPLSAAHCEPGQAGRGRHPVDGPIAAAR